MRKFKAIYALLAIFTFCLMSTGVTYAYFAANVRSESNSIQTESITYSINLDVRPIEGYTGFSLIPMNNQDAMKALRNECKDKYNRGACQAYTIRVYGYSERLDHISGYLEFNTNNMENLSYMVLEEDNESEDENCLTINEKRYCLSKEATSIKEEYLSLGNSYEVTGLAEKNLALVIWITNLNENQNDTDIGEFETTVTISAGDGGEIKGTIANALLINPPEGD